MTAPDAVNTKDWGVVATVEKWHDAADRAKGLPPDDTVSVEDNLLLNGGIQNLLDLLTATGSVTAYGTGGGVFREGFPGDGGRFP